MRVLANRMSQLVLRLTLSAFMEELLLYARIDRCYYWKTRKRNLKKKGLFSEILWGLKTTALPTTTKNKIKESTIKCSFTHTCTRTYTLMLQEQLPCLTHSFQVGHSDRGNWEVWEGRQGRPVFRDGVGSRKILFPFLGYLTMVQIHVSFLMPRENYWKEAATTTTNKNKTSNFSIC